MAIIVLTSATGAPGVTTTALGMALTWPRDVILVDADRDPSLCIPVGYLRGLDLAGRGLTGVAQAHREQLPLATEVWNQTVPLTTEQGPQRRFLPGFTHPGQASVFSPVWPVLANAFDEISRSGVDVIVDAGRIGTEGLPAPLIGAANAVLVVTQSSLRSLAAISLHVPGLTEHIEALPGHADLALIIVGEGRPYGAAEIEKQFGLPVWGAVHADASDARVLSDGAETPRRFEERPFLKSLRTLSLAVRSRLDERAAELQGRRVPNPQAKRAVAGKGVA